MNESLLVTRVKDLKGLIVNIYLGDTTIIPALIPLPINLDTLVHIHVVKEYIHTHINIADTVVVGIVVADVTARREYLVLGRVFGDRVFGGAWRKK